jgi:nitroreductase
VAREDIFSLCEAASWAMSSMNEQPWNYIITDKYHNENDYNKMFSCLVEWNQGWAKSAPVLIVSLAKEKFDYKGKANRHHQYDTGAASALLSLQATHLGLQAHQMGGFNSDKLIELFEVPEGFIPMSMIAVGYQSSDLNVIDESYHKDEKKDRERKNLGINFFDGQWQKPITGDLA